MLNNPTTGNFYPGHFVPFFSESEVHDEIRKAKLPTGGFAPVTVSETDDFISVEMALPGVKREDFLVQVNDHILTIMVMHREWSEPTESKRSRKLESTCVEREVELPANADITFSSAEYKDGSLCILISKSDKAVEAAFADIVVY